MSLIFKETISKAIRPDEYLYIWEWADKYRQLPKGSSAEPGKYKTSRVPYTKEVMEWLSPQDSTTEVVVIKGTQLGITEVANNVVFYNIRYPSTQLFILPSEDSAKRHSKTKINTSLQAMPELSKLIYGGKTGADIGNLLEKQYQGNGSLYITFAGDGSNLRSTSAKIVILDDVDGYSKELEGAEGNVLDLAKKRADAFGIYKKIYINSTPTIKGSSNIEKEFDNSDQRLYYMPCPYCTPKDKKLQNKDNMVVFEEEFFIYESKDYQLISEVFFQCPHCKAKIKENMKPWMMNYENGAKTIPTKNHKRKGLRLPSFLSPIGFVSWEQIFEEKLQALQVYDLHKRQDKLQVWENTRNAKPYDLIIGSMDINIANLMKRREDYKSEVPKEAIILTAGVDTQDNRLECSIIAYGKNETSYHIDHIVIYGDTSQSTIWEKLDKILLAPYKRDSKDMYIFCVGVDLGGHRSKEAYNFVKNKLHRRVFGVYGNNLLDDHIVKNRMSRNGTKLNKYSITVNSVKNVLYAYLLVDKKKDGYVSFPLKECYNQKYFIQLTSEVRDDDSRWINPKKRRNEALDCFVYSYASLMIATSIHKQLDLFDIEPYLNSKKIDFINPIRNKK